MTEGNGRNSSDRVPRLVGLRREIDALDDEILGKLAARMSIVRTIAEQKIQAGLAFRARREIEKIRGLEALAQRYRVPVLMGFDLWRIIMSQAAYQQQAFRLICLDESWLIEIAGAHFGRDVPLALSKNLEEMLAEQQAAPERVMCLIDKQRDDWWEAVAQSPGLSVVAELPWRGNAPPTSYLLMDCPIDLDAEADLLCCLHVPEAEASAVGEQEIAEVLAWPILAQRRHSAGGDWLLLLHDAGAHSSVESMMAKIGENLPAEWKLAWLGRWARFHREQPGV